MASLDPATLVYGLQSAGEPRISPDGSHVLFTLSRADRQADSISRRLVLCASDGSQARVVGGGREGGAWGGAWGPDGGQIAFLGRAGDDHAIYVRSMAGEPTEITRHPYQVADLEWSPDGSRLAYTAITEPENGANGHRGATVRVTRRRDYKHDGRGYVGDVRSHVYVLDVPSGRRRQITRGYQDRVRPHWSPDGQLIAVQARNLLGAQIEIVSVDSRESVVAGPPDGVVTLWAWSPTGDRILLAGEPYPTGQTDLFIWELETGTLTALTEELPVLPHAGSDWKPPADPVWLDDRRALLHALRGAASGLFVVDTETGNLSPADRWKSFHTGLSVDAARHLAVMARSEIDGVEEVVTYNAETRKLVQITDYNSAVWKVHTPASGERFDIVRGDFRIEAWLLFPPDFDPGRRYPVILDVHGGPNNFYGYHSSSLQQCLAAHGFLVVYCNPRGSTTYGRRFAQQVHGHWGEEDYRDLMAVLDTVLGRPYADPQRTGIYGYSYGGFMTAWTIGHTDRFRAAVCGSPVFDLESWYGTADISLAFARTQWGGAPHERPEWCWEHSPSTYALRVKTPTLIVHGEADERCPIGQGEQMFTALQSAGCEVEFARYPGASHMFFANGRPSQREDLLARVPAWFQTHLA